MKVGDIVRMSEVGKAALSSPCGLEGDHAPEAVGYMDPDGGHVCVSCSREHVLEFQDAIGEVIERIERDLWDVRWLPLNLRYAYKTEYLEIVQK